jgi:[acyl-carrier-protein] S-malonyltransferase
MSNFVVSQFGMVFPGQGSEQVGMLAELAGQHPLVGAVFAEASSVLGYDLWQLVQNGPAEQLSLTHITQPALLTSSYALWQIWQLQGGVQPALMAGHSLGEYSALVCAGALGFADAVALVRKRGELMQSTVPVGLGGMAAIIGLDVAKLEACCEQASTATEKVTAANFNSPEQVVISGHSPAVERAMALCKTAGAKRALPLKASAPFHTSLMQGAANAFAEVIAGVTLHAPRIPVLQNVGLQASPDPAQIRQNLIAQIAAPVPWVATMQSFAKQGVCKLVELGPGKVLAGLNKRIDGSLETTAVNDSASLQAALTLFGVGH